MQPMSKHLVQNLTGRLLVFDGPDGCGKTTMMNRMYDLMKQSDMGTIIKVREPGGTKYGEAIRNVLLNNEIAGSEALDENAEMLLFVASRIQMIAQIVMPALATGQTVLSDRFMSSTLAYQGEGLGLSCKLIEDIHHAAIPAVCMPYCTVIYDVCESVAEDRMAKGKDRDRIEHRGEEFHRRVRMGYIKQAAEDPDRHILVDANADEDETFRRTLKQLETFSHLDV